MVAHFPIWLLLGLVGLCLGSFVTTAAIRAGRGEAFLGGRSRCDHCGLPLSFAATVPLGSYLRQAGKAGCCSGRIDPLHIVGELVGLAIVLGVLAVAGPTLSAIPLTAIGFSLWALTLVDLRTRRLPNPLVAAVAICALFVSALQGREAVVEAMCVAALTFALLEALRRAFQHFRGQAALGGGDVKLLTALALGLGLLTPLAVAGASLLGLLQVAILHPEDRRIAFGPAIAAAGFIAIMVRSSGWSPL